MKLEEIEFCDKAYPKRLRRIQNPPKKLYILGNKEIINEKGIAIVGSRDCTKEGEQNAKIFGASIAKAGFVVISGMAKGIDASAHIGALKINRENNCSSWKWTKIYISSRK